MSESWSEAIWQSVTQADPSIKNENRFKLTVQSLALVMLNPELDIGDNSKGSYPNRSLQATVRRWHQDATLHRLISAFEDLGLSKDWPITPSQTVLGENHLALRDVIIRTLLEVRNLPIPKTGPTFALRSEDEWQEIFNALPEVKDTQRSRNVLRGLDAFMRDPECQWNDLGDESHRTNSAINDWERRGLLSAIVRKLTYLGLTSVWCDAEDTGAKSPKRKSTRAIIIQHLRKARKLATARDRRKQQAKTKPPFTWKTNRAASKSKPIKPTLKSDERKNHHSDVPDMPEAKDVPTQFQFTADEIERWRARRASRKAVNTPSAPISKRERDRLKRMQRPIR